MDRSLKYLQWENLQKLCFFGLSVSGERKLCLSFWVLLLIAKCWWCSLQLSNCVAGILHTKTCWMCWKRSIVIKSKMSFTRNDRMVMSRKKSYVFAAQFKILLMCWSMVNETVETFVRVSKLYLLVLSFILSISLDFIFFYFIF